jgi:hypothetical protein
MSITLTDVWLILNFKSNVINIISDVILKLHVLLSSLKWAIYSQFHKHFTYKFWQLLSSYMYIEKAAETMFV